MQDREHVPLMGLVEVDECYVGGLEEGRGGRSLRKKACVAAAVEMHEGRPGFGRIRLAHLEDASGRSLEAFLESHVEPGSEVKTDGWCGYTSVSELGYEHTVTQISGSGKLAHQLFPGVHRVFSLLQRLLLGTYQGAVSRHHLQKYLDEFEFRFNRRESQSRGLVSENGKGWPLNRWAA
jgi:transposase-like protein